ncbi:MAG: hypothetical protein ABIW76_20835 [Fibrobacteria bacterium]
MKTPAALMIALPILSLYLPASAHPGHAAEPVATGYVVSWIGVAPKASGSINPASLPDFWKKAFVSKIRLMGQPEVSPHP